MLLVRYESTRMAFDRGRTTPDCQIERSRVVWRVSTKHLEDGNMQFCKLQDLQHLKKRMISCPSKQFGKTIDVPPQEHPLAARDLPVWLII